MLALIFSLLIGLALLRLMRPRASEHLCPPAQIVIHLHRPVIVIRER